MSTKLVIEVCPTTAAQLLIHLLSHSFVQSSIMPMGDTNTN